MSYKVEFVTSATDIGQICLSLEKNLLYNKHSDEDISYFKKELKYYHPQISDDDIAKATLSDEGKRGLNETRGYYSYNLKQILALDLDNIDDLKDFGLVVVSLDDRIIGSVWLHFSDTYATMIGARSTIWYLLLRSIPDHNKYFDVPLQKLTELMIPFIINLCKERGKQYLYVEPLNNMARILTKNYGFVGKQITYDIQHLWGWNNNFSSRLTDTQIENEKRYSHEHNEEWSDDMANVILELYVKEL